MDIYIYIYIFVAKIVENSSQNILQKAYCDTTFGSAHKILSSDLNL